MAMQTLPRFGELVTNIELVLNFFNQRVDAARGDGGGDWSVDRVLDCIKGTRGILLLKFKRDTQVAQLCHISNFNLQ
jgi:hypothetical protein